MLSATTGRVASMTGRDRSDSTCSPCQSTVPPAGLRSRSALLPLPVLQHRQPHGFPRACRRSRKESCRIPPVALPNLVVIGAMKCGTTSLHHYLDLHPGMCRPKELNFFIGDDDGPG